jgi:hypothetical protein
MRALTGFPSADDFSAHPRTATVPPSGAFQVRETVVPAWVLHCSKRPPPGARVALGAHPGLALRIDLFHVDPASAHKPRSRTNL